jgi:hypothetical protein
MIVGREVDRLDETGVTRATVETVAENLVDGIVSPLFFAVLGGAPLAMAYKMVNTLDSMVGYRNDRYLHFGRFAARMDDVANFIPARLSCAFIALAAQLLNGRGRRHWEPPGGTGTPTPAPTRVTRKPPSPVPWGCGWAGPTITTAGWWKNPLSARVSATPCRSTSGRPAA